MLLLSLAIFVGLVLLVFSADRFVSSSVALARNFGMSPLWIGMTIIAFGTSAPEMVVSATAAFSGASSLAVGNVIGSNIANIGLVLGITTLFATLPIQKTLIKKELPLLVFATIVSSLLMINNFLSQTDGLILIGLLCLFLFFLSRNNKETKNLIDEVTETPVISKWRAFTIVIISLLLLLLSAKLLVWGATGVARSLGVSELVIGLTIVAIGTSLPELATTAASAMRGHYDMAIGNIIGSNLFNLLAVLPIPALISPSSLEPSVFRVDSLVMVVFTIALYIASFIISKKKKGMGKYFGLCLIASYSGYLYFLYLSAIH